jgi:hypothetical protein
VSIIAAAFISTGDDIAAITVRRNSDWVAICFLLVAEATRGDRRGRIRSNCPPLASAHLSK